MSEMTPEKNISFNPIDASVWRMGPYGLLLSNTNESDAAEMAVKQPDVIYFFAELTME